jgi:Zn finger protein HypA/HybF involved in hydrogenase expression
MLTKENTLNDFSYIRTQFSGLKTTIVKYHDVIFEIRKEYMCLECGTDLEIIVYENGVTTDNQTQFFNTCVSEVLCPACMCGTDKAVAGAAESLMALIN